MKLYEASHSQTGGHDEIAVTSAWLIVTPWGTGAYGPIVSNAAKKLFSGGSHVWGFAHRPQKSVFVARQKHVWVLQSSCANNNRQQRLSRVFTAPESNHGERRRGNQRRAAWDSPASHPALTGCLEGSLLPRRWTDQTARRQTGLYLPREHKQVLENATQEVSTTDATSCSPLEGDKANANGQRGQYASNRNGHRITFFQCQSKN